MSPSGLPVTLVHSHSWLNTAYTNGQIVGHEPSTTDEFWEKNEQAVPEAERPQERVTVPDGWLRGWDRALLAQFTVATHDQALMAALPVRFSALRQLALSGRTVIVDEVHAMSAFMLPLLKRLLHWLGALHCPVVILSATLPAHLSNELVHSYLAGSDKPSRIPAGLNAAPAYPGWIFAAAADASVIRMDPEAVDAHARRHRRHATIRLLPVRHPSHTDPEGTPERESRLDRISAEIAPVARGGGCAAVVCATIADAQETYQHLRATLDWPGGFDDALVLLHATLPGYQREARTRLVRERLGFTREPHERLVVVTTSLLDMSLNIDVDVMVSDLASLERLLQRLGRLWRFDNAWGPGSDRRPDWIRRQQRPRLSVLQPTDHRGNTLIPPAWRTLEPAFLTHATAAHLAEKPQRALDLTLPDDVQHLIETVHGDAREIARTTPDLEQRHTAYISKTREEEHLSTLHRIPEPRHTSSLADLHRQRLHARDAATRLGAMPRRLLPLYRTADGTLTLDRAGTRPLRLDREPTTALTRTILQHTLPVRGAWFADRRHEHHAPVAWRKHALLVGLR